MIYLFTGGSYSVRGPYEGDLSKIDELKKKYVDEVFGSVSMSAKSIVNRLPYEWVDVYEMITGDREPSWESGKYDEWLDRAGA